MVAVDERAEMAHKLVAHSVRAHRGDALKKIERRVSPELGLEFGFRLLFRNLMRVFLGLELWAVLDSSPPKQSTQRDSLPLPPPLPPMWLKRTPTVSVCAKCAYMGDRVTPSSLFSSRLTLT